MKIFLFTTSTRDPLKHNKTDKTLHFDINRNIYFKYIILQFYIFTIYIVIYFFILKIEFHFLKKFNVFWRFYLSVFKFFNYFLTVNGCAVKNLFDRSRIFFGATIYLTVYKILFSASRHYCHFFGASRHKRSFFVALRR